MHWYHVWHQCIPPCVHTVHTTVTENPSVWPKEMYPLLMRGTACQFHVAACTTKSDYKVPCVILEQTCQQTQHSPCCGLLPYPLPIVVCWLYPFL